MRQFKKIAVIGNYLPRQCGIGTFTTDLCNGLSNMIKCREDLIVVAMDDIEEGYDYPDIVKFQIRANVQSDYLRAADFLNVHRFDVAILQHEFGIFGGNNGSYILNLIQNLRMPVITALHTVLKDPLKGQRIIIQELARHSEFLVIMARKARSLLREIYGIANEKIAFIPHGIPDVPFEKTNTLRKQIGLENKKIILSFGLLSPSKGIEVMIQAMPEIIKNHPDAVYIILGGTHPHVIKDRGDSYRQHLYQLVNRLGIEKHVIFHNRFVYLPTLINYIQIADIYVTPYINEEQIVSGTLSDAVGLGAVVVSTPYWYATELLAEGRGKLTPFGDSAAMAKEITNLLGDEKELNKIRKKAYIFGRSMIWKEVASAYFNLAEKAILRTIERPIPQFTEERNARIISELPDINLNHMRMLTDDTGILQHANYTIPDRTHGYCVDDNARALIVASKYFSIFKDRTTIPLIHTYLSFLHHAFNHEESRFRNFMSYDRKWLENIGSEDSHGRSIWGLGCAIKYAPTDSVRNVALRLFLDGLTIAESFSSPRTWAFIIVGLHAYLEIYCGDANARRMRTSLAERLFALFKDKSSDTWLWFEDTVTYANAKIPHALILAGQWIPNPEMYETGMEVLKWLLNIQTSNKGHLSVIGNLNWYHKNNKTSVFDQQPIEAMSLVDACAEAFRPSADMKWLEEGGRCLGWFLGRNDINEQIYDFESGGCCDGIQPTGKNANQGAESTLSWLIALLTMYELTGERALFK